MTTGQGQPMVQNRRPNKNDNQIEKMGQYKNDTNTKTVQAKYKIGNQIEKWDKRSFYQGPGVKFPISWEKITLPP